MQRSTLRQRLPDRRDVSNSLAGRNKAPARAVSWREDNMATRLRELIVMAYLFCAAALWQAQMVDPSIDRPDQPFSRLWTNRYCWIN